MQGFHRMRFWEREGQIKASHHRGDLVGWETEAYYKRSCQSGYNIEMLGDILLAVHNFVIAVGYKLADELEEKVKSLSGSRTRFLPGKSRRPSMGTIMPYVLLIKRAL